MVHPPAPTTARPRALVVDDDATVRAVLRHGLESAGVDVLEASDGEAALQQLVDHLLELDLLVTDLRMPGIDGPSLVRIVRTEGGERELAILVLAGTVTPDDWDVLAPLGVDAVLEKGAGSEEAVRSAVALAVAARHRREGAEGGAGSNPATTVPLARIRRAG